MPNIIGTAPNQVPTNGDLGTMAFEDAINYNEKTLPNVIEVNSSNTALRVTQTGTGNALVVEDSANPDSTPFVVTADGNVGIGTTVPTTGLSIVRDGNTQFNFVRNSDNNAPPYFVNIKRRGTEASKVIVNNNDQALSIQAYGYDGSSDKPLAFIDAYVDGVPGTNDMPGRLVFSTTADGASSPTERMRIDNAGNVGVGTTSLTARRIGVGGTVTGATTAYGVLSQPTFQSDVTATANNYYSGLNTQATAFTLSTYNHFNATQATIGAGSTVTNQIGFNATSGLTGATNNYGFYSNIASGTGRYNFYAAGSADNYFAGNVGIGTTPAVNLDVYNATNAQIRASGSTVDLRVRADSSGSVGIVGTYSNVPLLFNTNSAERMRIDSAGGVGIGAASYAGNTLNIAKALTGAATAQQVNAGFTINSDVTTNAVVISTYPSTQAAAFTLANLKHYSAAQGTIGAGSTVTNQYGFIADASLTGATNNYGFYSNIASGTGRYNFYASGSADNYFAGNVLVGSTSSISGFKFIVNGSASVETGNARFDLIDTGNANYRWALQNTSSAIRFFDVTAGAERMRIDSSGNVIQSAPTTAPTLSTNGTMVFNLTSNTNLRVSVRGSDGVTRTANITLA